jgi:hypothetical protein
MLPSQCSVASPTDPTAITGAPVTFFVQPTGLGTGSESGNAVDVVPPRRGTEHVHPGVDERLEQFRSIYSEAN